MNKARAFTLLELLLAVALSGLLMIGVLAVITQLGAAAFSSGGTSHGEADETEAQHHLSTQHTLDATVRLLRDDLSAAISIDASKSRLVIIGYGALEARRRARRHRPVRVTYLIAKVEGQSWLIRRQRALDVLTNQNFQQDLVSSGIEQFELTAEQVSMDVGAKFTEAPAGSVPREDAAHGEPPQARRRDDNATTAQQQAHSPTAAAQPVETASKGGRQSYLYRGLRYYPENLPEHVRQTLPAAETSDPTSPDATDGNAPTPNENASRNQDAAATDQALETIPAQTRTLWRLNLWTDNTGEATHARIITVQ